MDALQLEVTAPFILEHLGAPSWRTLKFGLDNDLIAPPAFAELALALSHMPNGDQFQQLASAPSDEVRSSLLGTFAAEEEPAGDPKEAWLYLSLAWVHNQRSKYDDPLEMVEIIYADFDYPEDVEPLVRYMPSGPGEPPLGSDQLIARWGEYVEGKRADLELEN